MTNANGGLNNKQIILKGVVIKEMRELWGIKGIDEKHELKQLPTFNTRLLEYNLT